MLIRKFLFYHKRSGTEEEFTELNQLCEDILAFRKDTAKGEEMRKAAVKRSAS